MIVIYAKSKQKKYCANQLFTKVVPASGLRGEGGDGGDILLVFLIFNRNLKKTCRFAAGILEVQLLLQYVLIINLKTTY